MDPGLQLLHTDATPRAMADNYPWDLRYQLIGLGFVFYASIFLLAHILSRSLIKTYKSLQPKEKVFWNLAATRAVFGIQSSVAGLRALTQDSQLNKDIGTGQEDWSWFTILTATGFFIFENAAFHTYSLLFRSLDLTLATHHFFALAGYGMAVMSDSSGHFLPIVVLLLEMSTPFTCISWMLLKAGWSSSPFWKANQWVMIHMFHCRMFITYYLWWVSYNNWGEVSNNFPLVLRLTFFIGLALLTIIINPFWTYKKTMQLFNPVDWNFGNKPAPATKSMENQDNVVLKPHQN
ncbi:protein CLN8 [Stigmatopora nigra]